MTGAVKTVGPPELLTLAVNPAATALPIPVAIGVTLVVNPAATALPMLAAIDEAPPPALTQRIATLTAPGMS